ncbi:MAG: hypothetical protein FWE42_03255 [Defluviitaleaceae bacterium]|nr:hypothetical protein [Defluviitaleaceae bacterium]
MSDIRDTIISFTKNATKTSGDLFKTTKLSMSVSSEQTALKNLYLEIGKKVHEIYQYGGTLGKFFDEKFLELEACERKIEELKEEIAQIKGVRECGKCGKSAERTAEFCPKCGLRFGIPTAENTPESNPVTEYIQPTPQAAAPVPEQQVEPAPQPAQAPEPPPSTKRCRVCGMENDISTKFCLSCGRIVD